MTPGLLALLLAVLTVLMVVIVAVAVVVVVALTPREHRRYTAGHLPELVRAFLWRRH